MRIDYLADHVEQVVVVSEWPLLAPALDTAARAEILGRRLNRNRLPLAFVALSGSAPIGVVSLVDGGELGEEGAWLSDLWVPEELRRQGIGSALVRRAVEEAWELGFERLLARAEGYERFATGLGWTEAARAENDAAVVEITPTHRRA